MSFDLEDGGLSAAQQQLDELECMLSMFPNDEELKIDMQAKTALETYVFEADEATKPQRPECQLQYSLFYKDLAFGREVPVLRLMCPPGYPGVTPMEFEVQCPQLSRPQMEKLNAELVELAAASVAFQEVVGLRLYQQMHDCLSEVQANMSVDDYTGEDAVTLQTVSVSSVLGRRAIYFHHIIASNKRRVVKEWALELQLGGFSKIGWPGVVIVEGAEANVQEYVRRLQHLRWKQITVRGEQTEELGEGNLDELRRLPLGFSEFPEDGMSDLAAACRAAGLEELFLTTMKIYGRSEDKQIDEVMQPAKKGDTSKKKNSRERKS
ncbi:Major Facilitator Superfamily (MFS) [Phytophthora cinnamomi]|uniref:Major Facilitator Superfamily (MFS) n=1 Tax=Phytophthora cinnamomi TaxID=4785 RepID=UPI0035596341|nr:Major Facilitator Superfamily (MFS) [Phytophthora cinnamomi]